MNAPHLSSHRAAQLQLLNESRWMDALMRRKATRAASVSVPPISSFGGWRTSIAIRPEEFKAAEALVARRYAWRGYRVCGTDASGETGPRIMLLAEKGGVLMGTLTVRTDATHELFAARTYLREVTTLRATGHRVGELVKLAVEEGANWKETLDALVQSAYLITRVVHGLTDVLIEVNPRHARFYERVFGFVLEGSERFCERAGAPSVLMRLDLEHFGRRLQLAA